MPEHLLLILGVAGGAYLMGSVPFGLLLTKFLGGQDIRTVGSGNIGATNVLRTGRKDLAILTLFLDAFKATAAILLTHSIAPQVEWLSLVAATAALLGHLYPIWLGFKGGKGVATIAGCLIALSWKTFLAVIGIWLVVAFITRYSSLAAIVAALTLPFFGLLFENHDFAAWSLALSALIIYKHKENIARLRAGKESKIELRRRPTTD
ncbi:MAG: glycerol-3-phosphate 1-O-acyltransferase PlsY [Holosporales bacterium]